MHIYNKILRVWLSVVLTLGACFSTHSNIVYSSEIDSLIGTYESRDKHDLLAIYENLSNAAILARTAKQKFKESEAYYYLGLLNMENSEVQFAIDEFLKSEKIGIAQSLKPLLYERLGMCYLLLDKYDYAMSWYFQELNIYQKMMDQVGLAKANLHLGLTSNKMKDYDKAIRFFHLADKIYARSSDSKERAELYDHLGHSYKMKSDFDSSIVLYHNSYGMRMRNEWSINASVTNFVSLYSKLGLQDSVIYYLNMGVESNLKTGDYRFVCESLNSLGEFYYKKKEKRRAMRAWMEANDIAREFQFYEVQSAILQNLANINEEMGELNTSIMYHKLKSKIDGHLSDQNENRDIERAIVAQKLSQQHSMYDQEMVDSKIHFEGQISQSNFQRNILLVLGIVLLIFTLILGSVILQSRKKSKAIEERNRIINEQNEKLTKVVGTKEKLFSIIAHDLRSPMAALNSYLNMLRSDKELLTHEESKAYAINMYKSMSNITALMDSLLDWASVSREEIKLVIENINLYSVIEENLDLLRDAYSKKKLTLKVSVDENLRLDVDRKMMSTILRNLISNSIKFSPEKGEIQIVHKVEKGVHVINVIDQGKGVDPSNVAKLFIQGERLKKIEGSGSGLGLIICREFIERNGGTIQYIGNEKGANFELRIPLKK